MADPYFPDEPTGTKDAWHVLMVRDPHDEDGVTWLHPETCNVSVTSGKNGGVRYVCQVQDSLDNMGYHGIFARDDRLEAGVFLVHAYVEEIRGPDWTEWDGGWIVVPLTDDKTRYDT